ncbi:MAG: NAD(P)H-hydrate dehydratase [Saprospiraceae bacterium]
MLEKVNNHGVVIDADALNLFSQNSYLLKKLPKNSILTPHVGEFERLFGKCSDGFDRLQKQMEKSSELQVIIILKGAYTSIANPNGTLFFNTSGNPGMATGGSGDVLTGVITALLAQGYPPDTAAVLGVYIHGLSGDICKTEIGEEAMIASDIVEHLGYAFKSLEK